MPLRMTAKGSSLHAATVADVSAGPTYPHWKDNCSVVALLATVSFPRSGRQLLSHTVRDYSYAGPWERD